MSNSIILFYKYITIEDPQKIVNWQKKLCQQLHLKGRIIVATEGINGTLGGCQDAIDTYKNHMNAHPLFTDIDYKENKDTRDHFPRLRIAIKKEIVNIGLGSTIAPFTQAGPKLSAKEAHALLEKKSKDLIVIDCRNIVESEIGRIPEAIRPKVHYFREFPEYVDQNIDLFKDKTVLMYCTGGVRCERASAYIKTKNIAQEVYHINGGIYRYVEEFPKGFFKGKNYVFDGRTAVKITDDILGTCYLCLKPSDEYSNCMRADCNKHFIGCNECFLQYENFCSAECKDLIYQNKARKRPTPIKDYSHEHTRNKNKSD